MKVVAIYNMKGGVGKTTTAVNLSYLAAAGGARVLLWDLDPQAAASFAFRVRPRIEGFSRKSLESSRALAEAIKQTDYANLHLLPADFAYRKLDRFLDDLGKPKRVVKTLIEAIGREYDVVFLDCPAGFSLVTEGIFAAADAILVPTVPAVLSLRALVRLMKWADRSESTATLAAFFSMVDRRKTHSPASMRVVARLPGDLPCGTRSVRQHRRADVGQTDAARAVRPTRRRDNRVRRNLERARVALAPGATAGV